MVSLIVGNLAYDTKRFAPFFVRFDSVRDIYIPKNRFSWASWEFTFVNGWSALVNILSFSFVFDVGGW